MGKCNSVVNEPETNSGYRRRRQPTTVALLRHKPEKRPRGGGRFRGMKGVALCGMGNLPMPLAAIAAFNHGRVAPCHVQLCRALLALGVFALTSARFLDEISRGELFLFFGEELGADQRGRGFRLCWRVFFSGRVA